MTPMQWFRDHYDVPAEIGGQIKFIGAAGRILGSDQGWLIVHLDADPPDRQVYLHPTWRMDYLDGRGER